MNVIGLTGSEPVIEMKYQTFCSLCKRVIRRGNEAVTAEGGVGTFFIHPDCAVAKLTEVHNLYFHQESVKKDFSDHKSQTRVQNKKAHVSSGSVICTFCNKRIPQGQTFVKEDKKPYCNSGRTSCIRRYRAVNNRMAYALR